MDAVITLVILGLIVLFLVRTIGRVPADRYYGIFSYRDDAGGSGGAEEEDAPSLPRLRSPGTAPDGGAEPAQDPPDEHDPATS